MTSRTGWLNRAGSRPMRAAAALAIAACSLIAACATQDKLGNPRILAAPAYEGGAPLWAFVPLRNESGVSTVDTATLTDQLVYAAQQVQGLRVVPLNRTLAAMRAAELVGIDSPAQARRLAEIMGVDGIVVGSVTAWDPYDPPKLGMSLALFARPGAMRPPPALGPDGKPLAPPPPPEGVDPVTLRTSPTPPLTPPPGWSDRPAATASEHLDGANHAVQAAVKDYAEGRHETISALGWRRYLASSRLYADFACYRMVERLLDAERQRVALPAPVAAAGR